MLNGMSRRKIRDRRVGAYCGGSFSVQGNNPIKKDVEKELYRFVFLAGKSINVYKQLISLISCYKTTTSARLFGGRYFP